ncbi:MAG: hypothetical protein BWY19_00762 [bacterium ADurb.Bin212]|nr:MAG: hypothetical protein BWY19_00762 [bacterium ADurb.Bin212]
MGKLISIAYGLYQGVLWLKARWIEFEAKERLLEFKKKLRKSSKNGNTKEIQDEITRIRNDS